MNKPLKQIFSNKAVSLRMPWLFSVVMYLYLGISNAHAQIKTDHQSSTVAFSGQHAGMNFKGKFERWQATLVLPPQNNSTIIATFYMNSAKTGDSIYDSTLPEFDWFDVENFTLGKFASTSIVLTEDGYQVLGNLTLKNITKPVDFMLKNDKSELSASFGINRLDYQIGLESDPEAEWVDKTITITMVINK